MRICSIDGCINKHCAKGLCQKHRAQFRKYGKAVISIYEISTETRFRFRVKLNNENGCVDWISTIDGNGYGEFRINGKLTKAHRYSYESRYGLIPNGLSVLHHCDRPCCVNPEHLFLGTQQDNIIDMDRKKRRGSCFGSKNAKSKLTEDNVKKIKIMLNNGELQKNISKIFNVSAPTISSIFLKKTWKHINIGENK